MDEKDEGFTLIELLVVVIIIGILAAIAIPVFLNQRKKGYDAQAKSDIRNFATAQETYFTDANTYGTAVQVHTASPVKIARNVEVYNYTVATGATIVGFCVVGTNTASDKWFAYDSTKGGMLPTGYTTQALAAADCTATATAAGSITNPAGTITAA